MMRATLSWAFVIAFLAAEVVVCPPGTGGEDPPPAVEEVVHVPLSPDLAVYPGPDAWTREPHLSISVRILNATFVPKLETSELSMDGSSLVPDWDPVERIVLGTPVGALQDGVHHVRIILTEEGPGLLTANWSFTQDTVVPWLDFDPLPAVAAKRVYTVNGTVDEPNLKSLDVNGFPAIVDAGNFSVPVLLWPERTDLLASAYDQAGNCGLAAGSVLWFPPDALNHTYVRLVHANASFAARFPSDWDVRIDAELEPGLPADVLAVNVSQPSGQSNVAIVSRVAGIVMTDAMLLAVMQDALLDLGNKSTVSVVARPRPVSGPPGATAARFSAVETLLGGERVFRYVTGFWSRAVGRIWLVMGSLLVEDIEEQWHAIHVATASFEVILPPSPPSGDDPRGAIDRALLVTVAAIVFVVVAFLAVLASLRRRKGRRFPRF